MNIRYLYFNRTTAKAFMMFSLGVLMLAWSAGCSQNFGRISWDEDVSRSFEANQFDSDYNFYQYTIGNRVLAIAGLDPKLELQSRIWRELDVDTEDFDVATSRMWEDYSQVHYYARGATILDPAGERVGVYFSSIRFVSIHFRPNNQVQLVLDTSVFRGGSDDRRTP